MERKGRKWNIKKLNRRKRGEPNNVLPWTGGNTGSKRSSTWDPPENSELSPGTLIHPPELPTH